MARYDSQNTGHRSDGLTDCAETRWEYRIKEGENEEFIIADPVVVDQTVYLPTTKGLQVFDAATGEHRWHKEGFVIVSSVVIEDICWFATWDPPAGTSAIHALHLPTSRIRWSRPMSARISTDLMVSDGRIFVGDADGTLRAFNAKTGEMLWEFESKLTEWILQREEQSQEKGFYGAPATKDGCVYAPCENGNLYAFDAKTGDERWRFETKLWMRGGVAVNDGRVHVPNAHQIFTLDISDGSEIWRTDRDEIGTVERGPTVANGVVYQMTGSSLENLQIQAFDAATGQRRWATPIAHSSEADPCVVNGRVYVGADGFHAFDARTGKKRWTMNISSKPSGMAFIKDAAYFAEYNRLYAVS